MKKVLSVLGATLGLLLYAVVAFLFIICILMVEYEEIFLFGFILLIPVVIILITKRFKGLLALALTLLLTMISFYFIFPLFGGDVAYDNKFGYSKNDDGTITVSFTEFRIFEHDSEDVVLPSSFKKKEVTGVELRLKKDVKSITVPATVKTIKIGGSNNSGSCRVENLFYEGSLSEWCENVSVDGLSKVDKLYINGSLIEGDLLIPDDVTKINDFAFAGYSRIRSVTFWESSNLVSIGEKAFYDCDRLWDVNFSENSKLSSIGDNAFAGCEKIFSFTLPENLMYLGKKALPDDLIEIYNLSTLSYDDADVIHKNSSAKSVIENIDGYLFVAVGDSSNKLLLLDYIGYGENLHIPELGADRIVIYNNAFLGCESIVSVTIPSNVAEIGNNAFCGCTSLENIKIGRGLTSIGESAFSYCNSVRSVEIDKNNAKYYIESNCIIEKETYTVIRGFSNTIPSYARSIGESAFEGCDFTSIHIPDSVTSIGDHAFYSCNLLTELTFAENTKIEKIGSHAFYYCESLSNVEFPNKLSAKALGEYSFNYKKIGTTYKGVVYIGNKENPYRIAVDDTYLDGPGLWAYLFGINVVFHKDTTMIASSFVPRLNDIKSITIPKNIELICEGAFARGGYSPNQKQYEIKIEVEEGNKEYYSEGNCLIEKDTATLMFGLNNSTIPEGVKIIGDYAFSNCDGITDITIPNSVIYIGKGAFSRYKNLTNVHISDLSSWCNIEFADYGSNPLYSTENLYLNGELVTELIIPDGVTSINDYAFINQDGLISVVIPDSVTSIGDEAFSGCDNLTSVVIGDGITSISYSAFDNCDNLADVYYTGTEEEWFANFGWDDYFGDATIHFNYVPKK